MARKAEYEDLKRRLEAAYRMRCDEVNRKGQEVTQDAYARMNQAYDLLQRRFEVDKLEVANESAAMKQCIQELESQATLKHAVVEYQASTYVEKQKLEAQAREAEQYQELRMFEHHTKMEVILQAQGRDAEIRAQYEAELLERQRRNDVEARRLLEVERQKIAMTSQFELQNMQAKMMHCEAVASRAHHEFEEHRRAAAEEVAAAYAGELQRLECARELLEEELAEVRARERTKRVEEGRMEALEVALDAANLEAQSLRTALAQAKTK